MMEMTSNVLDEVLQERLKQEQKWGEQNHPNGEKVPKSYVDKARTACDTMFRNGEGTWSDILHEEFWEALGECDDDAKLREELIQVAAVAVAWIECIDRRNVG